MVIETKYPLFIAYHGSNSSTGTEQLAFSFQKFVKQTISVNPYCGPATDESLFTEHMTKVIPNSQLFLLVVNDDVPKNNFGQIDKNISKFLYAEIDAFVNLVKQKRRSKKDFAVYYAGNLKKNENEVMTYINTLLSEIDPEAFLSDGNQYYLMDYTKVGRWISERRDSFENNPIYNDYFPFEELQKFVLNFVTYNPSGEFMIQMERGMGKTTFVKSLSSYFNECKLPFDIVVKDFYISSEKNYSFLSEFAEDFTSKFRETEVQSRAFLASLDVDSLHLSEAMYRFISEYKTALYYGKKILVVIDGIDEIAFANKQCILDYFKNLKKIDGVYFLFTSRIPKNAFSENTVSNKVLSFISSFRGEKIIIESNDIRNVKFLRRYFEERIISQFKNSIDAMTQTKIFFELPKSILMFSIIYKISKFYLESFKGAQENIEFLNSVESAFSFCYKYMSSMSSDSTVSKFIDLICFLSLSEAPIKRTDIVNFFGDESYDKLLEDYPFSSIFIVRKYVDNEERFDVVHSSVKELLIKTNLESTKKILGKIFFDSKMILSSSLTMSDFYSSSFSCFKLLKPLVESDYLSNDDKSSLLNDVTSLNFEYIWTKNPIYLRNEIFLLSKIAEISANGIASVNLDKKKMARVYGVLGLDLFIKNYYVESQDFLMQSENIYKAIGINALNNEDILSYAEVLSFIATLKLENNENIIANKYFEQAVKLYEKLWKQKFISDSKYLSNLISYCNTLCAAKLYHEQNKNLNLAFKMLKNIVKPYRLTGFYYSSLGDMLFSKKNYSKAFEAYQNEVSYYELAHAEQPDTLYIGDLIKSYTDVLKASFASKKDNAYLLNLCKETEMKITNIKAETGFHNINHDLVFLFLKAEVFLNCSLIEECKDTLLLIKNILDYETPSTNSDYSLFVDYKEKYKQIESKIERID